MTRSKVDILDHGYVELLDVMGDDNFIAKFARGSFGEEEYVDEERNVRLVRYLLEHYHMSPIEAGEMAFKVRVPIFAARQLVRHRACSFNELSLRYSIHEGLYYVPELWRIQSQDKHNKQGSGESMPDHIAKVYRHMIRDTTDQALKAYNLMIDNGVARETARMILPTNMYTVIYMKCDTRNLLNLLYLRDDEHAQWEIREMAKVMASFFKEKFPALYSAFEDFMKNSVSLSSDEAEAVRKLLDYLCEVTGEDLDTLLMDALGDDQIYGSKRRFRDCVKKLTC